MTFLRALWAFVLRLFAKPALQATFDADYDEHPHEAAIRLGIMRRDVA